MDELRELAAMPGNTVGTKTASRFLGCDRWTLSVMAKEGKLPFRYFFSGNRLHIVKASLLDFLGYVPELADDAAAGKARWAALYPGSVVPDKEARA